MAIFVSIEIRGDIDQVWTKTQDPKIHERWDLRFTHIDYLPKPSPDAPQRFLYETRIGFGIKIAGEGESIATREGAAGQRTSSLKFWSDQSLALIKTGSGYWKYVPTEQGTHFETGYDYEPRWGAFGKLVDAIAFRPLLAWATAWSFDSLRQWIEDDIQPNTSRQKAAIHAIARLAIAFVWIWHGLVPKLLVHDPAEAQPLLQLHIAPSLAATLVTFAGLAEIVIGLATLLLWRNRLLLLVQAFAFALLGTGAIITVPSLAGQAFNPVSFTACLVALCITGYIGSKDLPSAKNCIYSSRGKQ